jgi:chondroitin 4-sulfotransferase 11
LLKKLPLDVRYAVMAKTHRRLWEAAGIVFVHIPKAADTSIGNAIYGRHIGHSSARQINLMSPGALQQLPSFALSRNPWDRAVSAYQFVMQDGTEHIKPQRQALYDTPAFSSFERYVEEWLAVTDLEKARPAFRPQQLYVTDKRGSLLVNRVLPMEDMHAVQQYLEETMAEPMEIRHLNRSKRGDYRDYYTSPRLRNIVGDVYSRDVTLFNYDF